MSVEGSFASSPASELSIRLQSATVRPIGPQWSSAHASGITPYELTNPNVGLIDVTPRNAAGIRSDPSVSDPIAAGTIRAASAAALPPLEPPVIREGSHGLPHWGVNARHANSSVWVCPSRTIPAVLSFVHAWLSPVATLPASTCEDAVTGSPLT